MWLVVLACNPAVDCCHGRLGVFTDRLPKHILTGGPPPEPKCDWTAASKFPNYSPIVPQLFPNCFLCWNLACLHIRDPYRLWVQKYNPVGEGAETEKVCLLATRTRSWAFFLQPPVSPPYDTFRSAAQII